MLDYNVKTQKQWDTNYMDMNEHKIKQIKRWNDEEIDTDKFRLERAINWKMGGKDMRHTMYDKEQKMYSYHY